MKLVSIEFRNIGPYGNKLQTLNFDNSGKLVLLQGKSGDGKSTLLNLPTLLLYGQIPGRKQTGIANRINRNGYIRGIVVENNNEYIIERKFQPNSVKIFKNGEDLDKIGIKDAQDYIDNNIVQMPMKIFSNIVSLSMVDFKSFLNMGAEDRRQIIDRVFSLEMINEVHKLVSSDFKAVGDAINNGNSQKFTLETTIAQANQELARLSESQNTQNSEQITVNNKVIEDESKLIETYSLKIKELNDMYNIENQKYQQFNANLQKISMAISMIQQKLGLYNQGQCPTCGASFQGDDFSKLKTELEDKLQKSQEMLKIENDNRQQVANKMNQISQSVQQINSLVYQSQNKINIAKNDNLMLNEAMKQNIEYKSIQNIIDANTEALKKVVKQIESDTLLRDKLGIIDSIYTNDGVKKYIMRTYLPHLNKEINKSLESMDFPYKLTFNEQFNAKLFYLSQEIGTDTLSVGEHKRVDLAVLCSVFKLIRKKYPSINLFTLDEVLSSLDPLTATLIIGYLKDFADELNLNIYVVSHVDMEENLFDESIKVYKEMGFSDIKIESK